VFSAHGVPKSVPAEARRRDMMYVDATCPLVSKVHHEAEHHHAAGRQIVLIGHAGHPEVLGTMGQLPDGAIILVDTIDAVAALPFRPDDPLAYITQTTLSVDDTAAIVQALKQRYPDIEGPSREDICYATTNRQGAVKVIAPRCDALVVVGAPNSSNSQRLVEVARGAGCPTALLLQSVDELDWRRLEGVRTLGITAGASAPEILVDELVAACRERYDLSVEEVSIGEESMHFNLPRVLSA